MSYILDALRKSEEARRRQQGPDLSLADSTPDAKRERSQRALPLLALALLVNGAVLGIWLWRSATPEPSQSLAAPTAAPESGPASAAPSVPPAAEAAESSPARSFTAGSDTTRGSAEVDWRQLPIKRLDELTPRSRSRFPSLAISTHIYADDARFREVSINGRRYQEGDSVAGLALLEITATGVLVGYEEQVIRLDLQDEWAL